MIRDFQLPGVRDPSGPGGPGDSADLAERGHRLSVPAELGRRGRGPQCTNRLHKWPGLRRQWPTQRVSLKWQASKDRLGNGFGQQGLRVRVA